MLRCQVQLKLTLMMCMGDHSTFTSTDTLSDSSTFTSTSALSDRHDGSSSLFLEDLLSSRGVCVFARAQSFHGIRAWYRLKAEQQAQEAKEAIRRQEVIISSPFMFTTTPMSEHFGRHQQTTSDQGAVFSKTKL
jgi:hypothetical protein